jgi:hypothetical protein
VFLLGLPRWFHWPDHGGYNFVSGPLADITLATAFLSWLLLFWHKHNCHVHRCLRLSWHPHPDHGHPVCKKHFPHHRHLGRATGPHSAGSTASSSSSAGPAP